MENLNLAKDFYNNKGINSVYTVIVKTDKNNFVYHHILNGNSIQEDYFYKPSSNTNEKATSPNILNTYLTRVLKLECRIVKGFYRGIEVKQMYEANEQLKILAPIFIY